MPLLAAAPLDAFLVQLWAPCKAQPGIQRRRCHAKRPQAQAQLFVTEVHVALEMSGYTYMCSTGPR